MDRREQADRRRNTGMSLVEWILAGFIVLFIGAIVFPPHNCRDRGKARQAVCLSQEKLLARAFLAYAEDYEGQLPPVTGFGAKKPGGLSGKPLSVYKLVEGYDGIRGELICSAARRSVSGRPGRDYSTYLYNDLIATCQKQDVALPAVSVLVMDGEPLPVNAGHAWVSDTGPFDCRGTKTGQCAAGQGATVRFAVSRHQGGASYVFLDGHCKWLKPEQVFFPERASNSRSHRTEESKAVGPDPAGRMTFAGRRYTATFHTR